MEWHLLRIRHTCMVSIIDLRQSFSNMLDASYLYVLSKLKLTRPVFSITHAYGGTGCTSPLTAGFCLNLINCKATYVHSRLTYDS